MILYNSAGTETDSQQQTESNSRRRYDNVSQQRRPGTRRGMAGRGIKTTSASEQGRILDSGRGRAGIGRQRGSLH